MHRWSFNARDGVNTTALRRQFVRALRDRATDESDIPAAELIYGELLGNAVQHARGNVSVELDWSNEHATLCVQDAAKAFAPPMRLPDDPLSESGRGLYIVKTLARDFRIDDVPDDGSKITAVLPVEKRTT